MAIQDKRKQEDVEIDMTPMLDIVFIMLIFFIVTTVFVKQAGVDVVKPLAQTAEERKMRIFSSLLMKKIPLLLIRQLFSQLKLRQKSNHCVLRIWKVR